MRATRASQNWNVRVTSTRIERRRIAIASISLPKKNVFNGSANIKQISHCFALMARDPSILSVLFRVHREMAPIAKEQQPIYIGGFKVVVVNMRRRAYDHTASYWVRLTILGSAIRKHRTAFAPISCPL